MDELDLIIYRVVHDYPGGARGLAPAVGMNAGTLNNKADPAMGTHQLTVRQAIAIQLATRDHRILATEAMQLGCTVVPVADYSNLTDLELLDSYAEWHREIGETAAAIREAISNRRVSHAAVNKVKREIFEDTSRALAFLQRLEWIANHG